MPRLLLSLLLAAFVSAASAQTTDSAESELEQLASAPEAVHPRWEAFEPRFQKYICPFGAGVSYDPGEFVCGYVLVPEDRTDPESRLIKLSVMKIVSTVENPPGGALIRLTGGPGGPSLSAGRIRAYQAPQNRFMRDAADLIFFDQRGIGYSEAGFCRATPLSYQYGVPTEPDGFERLAEDLTRCLGEARTQGVSIDAYSTWHNALDVRDIRRALGYEQWTLFGVSYGTELGQAAMAVDPEGVRAAVLDSVVPLEPPAGDERFTLAAGFRSSLNAVDAMCAADPACARDFGSLSERFVEAFRGFEADPLVLEDVPITKSGGGRLVLDGSTTAGAVFQALYRNQIYPDLPALLRVLETRDAEALRAYVSVLGYDIDHAYGHGMSWVTNCRGGLSGLQDPERDAKIAETEPDLSRWMGTIPQADMCARVYGNELDPSAEALVSDIPTLVVAGTVDPITPPLYSESILPGLSNATYVEFPYTGHGPLVSHFDGCGGRILRDFVIDPGGELNIDCAADLAAPAFLTRLRETKGPYRFALALQRGDYPVPLLLAAGMLALTLAAYPLGALARRIDRDQAGPLGRARALSWLGAAASLAGLALAIRVVLNTGLNHPTALPVGVPTGIGWAGWLGLFGAGLAAAGIVQALRWRRSGQPNIGTVIGLAATAGAALFALIWLVGLGAGPL
ncbi:MAG: alpha/beta hydrolase [Pseudomonadota bacterium]